MNEQTRKALEGQRDAANESANAMHAMLCAEVEKVKALEAERDRLRARIASAIECIQLSGNSDFYVKKALRILDSAT